MKQQENRFDNRPYLENASQTAVFPHQQWLPWAKTAVAIHIILSLLLFSIGTVEFFALLTTPCLDNCFELQLTQPEINTLISAGLSVELYAIYQIALEVIYLIAFSAVAFSIYVKLVRKPTPQIWYHLLASFALISVATVILPETIVVAANNGPVWQFLYKLLKASGNAAFLTFCLLFPDGRFIPKWIRWPIAGLFLWMLTWIALPLPQLDVDAGIGLYFSLSMLALIVVVQVYRYRWVSTAVQRQQTKWFVYGFGLMFFTVFCWALLNVILPFQPGVGRLWGGLIIGQGLLAFFSVMVAVCIGISLLHYRLWDIDIILNRTLVYGGLTLFLTLTYMLLVGGVSLLWQSQNNLILSLLATGLIAVLFQPARERLQRAANRLMFGERDDPYAALSRLTDQLQTTNTPEAMLQSIVQTIAHSLKLPYVAIELADGQGSLGGASTGIAVATTVALPLRYQNETVGHLVVSPRSPSETFTEREQKLLADMAGQTGAMAYSVRLTAALQRSREKLVLTREEERRRIRRDLHDELGPTLASQTFLLDTAFDLIKSNPDSAANLLLKLKTQNQATVAHIRQLVYELRPPTLDELGLFGALEAHTANINGRSTLHIQLNCLPNPLPPLSAAVEVAAYRIILEALNNVVRHSQANRCSVHIELTQNGRSTLHIQIHDDGIGIDPHASTGVGLSSMKERAEELGGHCAIRNDKNGGTRITAVLPMA